MPTSIKSIAGGGIALLEQHVPTAAQLKRRRRFYQKALQMTAREPLARGPFPPAEEMIREDRER